MKKNKLHLPLLRGLEQALRSIFDEGKKSDHVVPALLKANPKWGSRDRNFIAENTYEIVRNKRLIQYVLGGGQEITKMIGAWLILKGQYDDSAVFAGLNVAEIRERAEVQDPAIRFSVPDPLNEFMISELGEDRWYRELAAMNVPAEVYLRVNLRFISREKLQKRLQERGIETEIVTGATAALRLTKRANLTATPEFQKGCFEIQDAGSQLIGEFLNPRPGTRVVDACAGAGGKTLHLADLMADSGRIEAMDVEAYKLKELNLRAARNRVSGIKTTLVSTDAVQELAGEADYLLLDVPCSGTGVIRRNPDAKERLTSDFVAEIRTVQEDILNAYSVMVKPGGTLVYATCSLLPSENKGQVDRFLAVNKEFKWVEDRQIWPSETNFDGFYMARLEKLK